MAQNNASEVFTVDFDIDPSAALCPAGTHDCKVIHAEAGPAKKAENGTQIVVTFEVLTGPAKGRQVKKWYFTSGNASIYLMKDLRAFGVDDLGKVKLSQKTFLGKKVKVVVEHTKNSNTGEDQANVSRVLPFNTEVPADSAPSAAKSAPEPLPAAESDTEAEPTADNPF